MSLWGEEFEIKDTVKEAKKIISKINKPKAIKTVDEKISLKSKKLSIEDKLNIINENVTRILGIYKESTIVINSRETLDNYINQAISNGIIAIDTETNNSLDPITCKLMGPCIYTPGQKQAYIPINHIDLNDNRLDNQLTESDIREAFSRLVDTKIIMHNGKFDYQVIKCTTGLELAIYWDTLIGAKLLDENEHSAGLKQQYIEKIDPSIEKYSIDYLFEDIEYAYVNPEIFALYAATDAFMTYKLYEWQKARFNQPENARLLNLANTLEMPLVKVIAEMELAGMEVDQEYAQLLSAKYHNKLDQLDKNILAELDNLKPIIDEWRLTDDANFHPVKKTGIGEGKSKSEQLSDPINLGSPTQLAILFYDVLKAPVVNKKQPRATGEDALNDIAKALNLPICDLIIKRREQVKLISTYIDVIPELAKRWPDGRVRTHFNQYGAATGRLSSSEPINFQNIPSHNKEIRMLFKAKDKSNDIYPENNKIIVNRLIKVKTPDSMKYSQDLKIGDMLRLTDDEDNSFEDVIIKDISLENNTIIFSI